MPDVEIDNQGSLILFLLLTGEAHEWAEEHIPAEAFMGAAFVCEPRYAGDIIAGMVGDGLEVAG